ncbi:MAG: hypothetical protein AB1Z38_06625 [Desulfotignum sp.]
MKKTVSGQEGFRFKPKHGWKHQKQRAWNISHALDFIMEAAPGFEPGISALQAVFIDLELFLAPCGFFQNYPLILDIYI